MDPVEHDHDCQHEQSVKYVEENLVTQKVPGVTLDVLNDPEDAPHHNETAGEVEIVQMALPR
jgi:hypothetical protein